MKVLHQLIVVVIIFELLGIIVIGSNYLVTGDVVNIQNVSFLTLANVTI